MDEKMAIPAAVGDSQQTALDFKSLREAKGLSLRDIFKQTRVGLVYLAAVEKGDFSRLPPPVYARNFIRKYAQSVGVDEDPILTRYDKYLGNLQPSVIDAEVQQPWPESGGRNRFLFLSLTAVVIAGVLISVIFLYDRADKPPLPSPAISTASPEPAIPTPAPAAADPPATAVANVAMPASVLPETTVTHSTPDGKTRRLTIEAHELTWIRITEDRNPGYEVMLKPGDKIERTASDHFQLDIGNAGGVNLTFQGKPMGSLGNSGQPVHMRLPEMESDRRTP